jgi:hypothetical protein
VNRIRICRIKGLTGLGIGMYGIRGLTGLSKEVISPVTAAILPVPMTL